MTTPHPGTGNPPWRDLPSTDTLVTAAALEAIEAILDRTGPYPGAWTALASLTNGWANRAGTPLPRLRFVSPTRVEMAGVITKSAGGANGEQIGTLPAVFRPAAETIVPLLDSGGRTVGLRMTTAGAMHIYASQATASTLTLCGTYPLDPPALA